MVLLSVSVKQCFFPYLHNAVHEAGGAQVLQSPKPDGGVWSDEPAFAQAAQRQRLVGVGQPRHEWHTNSQRPNVEFQLLCKVT